jgi:NADH:ubiquinone oxidoreductase subunit K
VPTFATSVLEFTTLAITIAMVVVGVALLLYLPRRGGFELGLAHVVADPHRRRVFLGGLSTSLTAFVASALADTFETLTGTGGEVALVLGTLLFAVGASGILLLMANALRSTPLSFEEEWTLRENAERVNFAATPVLIPPDLRRSPGSEPSAPADPRR